MAFIIVFTACTDSQNELKDSFSVNLWPDSLSIEVQKEKILPPEGDDILRITDVNEPSMEVYLAKGNEPKPAIIVFPGGGYRILAYDLEGTEVAQWLNSIGISAMVVKYSVPDRREFAFADGQRAIKTVKESADKWNINKSKIGVLGFSAGGHLAARLSTNYNSLGYQKIDSVDDQSARPDFSILVYPAYLNIEGTKDLAPEVEPSEYIPPIFIVQTSDDTNFVGGTKVFSKTLDSIGVKYKFHLIKAGGHGYGLRADTSLEISKWPDLTESWLKKLEILK